MLHPVLLFGDEDKEEDEGDDGDNHNHNPQEKANARSTAVYTVPETNKDAQKFFQQPTSDTKLQLGSP